MPIAVLLEEEEFNISFCGKGKVMALFAISWFSLVMKRDLIFHKYQHKQVADYTFKLYTSVDMKTSVF